MPIPVPNTNPTPPPQASALDVPVLVEWRNAFEGDRSPAVRLDALVDFLAAMHSAENESDLAITAISASGPWLPSQTQQRHLRNVEFGMLRCLGWTIRKPSTLTSSESPQFGLVFQYPISNSRPPCSLCTRITDSRRSGMPVPPLGDRFDLAFGLVSAVANIIAIGWIHRALRSSNMLLFDERATRKIYLIGFAYAREGEAPGQLSNLPIEESWGLYRPPADDQVEAGGVTSDEEEVGSGEDVNETSPPPQGVSEQRSISVDMYGLGVVLLEIGLWQTVDSLMRKSKSPSTEHFHRQDINGYIDQLSSRCGDIFRGVVCTCLRGDNWERSVMQENLSQLLTNLKGCKA